MARVPPVLCVYSPQTGFVHILCTTGQVDGLCLLLQLHGFKMPDIILSERFSIGVDLSSSQTNLAALSPLFITQNVLHNSFP